MGLISYAFLSIALGRAKTFPFIGYFFAGVFFLSFFKIWPFHG